MATTITYSICYVECRYSYSYITCTQYFTNGFPVSECQCSVFYLFIRCLCYLLTSATKTTLRTQAKMKWLSLSLCFYLFIFLFCVFIFVAISFIPSFYIRNQEYYSFTTLFGCCCCFFSILSFLLSFYFIHCSAMFFIHSMFFWLLCFALCTRTSHIVSEIYVLSLYVITTRCRLPSSTHSKPTIYLFSFSFVFQFLLFEIYVFILFPSFQLCCCCYCCSSSITRHMSVNLFKLMCLLRIEKLAAKNDLNTKMRSKKRFIYLIWFKNVKKKVIFLFCFAFHFPYLHTMLMLIYYFPWDTTVTAL